MAFVSKAQRGYIWVHHPEIAREFEKKTLSIKVLPEKVKKKRVEPSESAFTYPELQDVDKFWSEGGKPARGGINPGDAERAFGNRMEDSGFRKELRKLQEKHKVTGYA